MDREGIFREFWYEAGVQTQQELSCAVTVSERVVLHKHIRHISRVKLLVMACLTAVLMSNIVILEHSMS